VSGRVGDILRDPLRLGWMYAGRGLQTAKPSAGLHANGFALPPARDSSAAGLFEIH